MTTLPSYVSYGGDPSLRGPVNNTYGNFYTFALKGQFSSIKQTVDTYLNTPTNGALHYTPLTDIFLIMYCPLTKAQPQPVERGWVSYTDVIVGVPVIRWDGKLPRELCIFTPYIYVDNVLPFITGREVYGFPKTLAAFNDPAAPEVIGTLTLDTMSVKRMEPNEQNVWNRLWEITPTEEKTITRWGSQDEALNAVHNILFYEHLLSPLEDRLIEDALRFLQKIFGKDAFQSRFVNLKQFRDAAQQDKACYQAVVETPLIFQEWRGGGLLGMDGAFTLTLNDIASIPFSSDLGLKPGRHKTIAAFWMEIDAQIGIGENMWVAGQ